MNTTGCPAGYANDDWIDSRRYDFGGRIDMNSTLCTVPVEALNVLCYIWIAIEVPTIPLMLKVIYEHQKNRLVVATMLLGIASSGFQIAFLFTRGVPGATTMMLWGLVYAFGVPSILLAIYEHILVIPEMFALRYDFHKDFLVRMNIGLGVVCVLTVFFSWSVVAPVEFSNFQARTTAVRVGCAANAFFAVGIGLIPYYAMGIMISLIDSISQTTENNELQATRKKFAMIKAIIIPNVVMTMAVWVLTAALFPFYWFLVFPLLFCFTIYKYGVTGIKSPQRKQKASQVTSLRPTDSGKTQNVASGVLTPGFSSVE